MQYNFRHSAESEDLQLTNSGNDSVVYNGIPDWVSEEEVFEDNKALWWSPDGSKLVYGVFNDTLVDIVNLPRYGNWHNTHTNRQGYPYLQYFMMDPFRYPKSGTTNPTVTLWYADVGPPGIFTNNGWIMFSHYVPCRFSEPNNSTEIAPTTKHE